MKRKHLGILHILFMILLTLSATCIIPVTTVVTTQNYTTTDSNIMIESPIVTTTIQDVINHAQPNSTIQLPAGIYTEILTINKPLHLKGEGAQRTFFSTASTNNGYTIKINAKGVTLSGIDITNQGLGLYTSCIKISASNTTIRNCTFHDTPIGLFIRSSQNTISRCEFRGCDDEGIALLGTPTTACTNNTIVSCNFSENCDGIEFQYATNNLITSCTFTQNTHAGIDAIESNNNNNIISYCKFTNNQAFGLYLARSSHNLITQCLFSNDTILLVCASDNTLHKSQVEDIHLLDESTLFIEQCKGINTSEIISEQSSFEIQTNQSEQSSQEINTPTTGYYPILLNWLSRFSILKQIFL